MENEKNVFSTEWRGLEIQAYFSSIRKMEENVAFCSLKFCAGTTFVY
jgi:hypothetical protein